MTPLETKLIEAVKATIRSDKADNLVQNLTDSEFEIAMNMALSHINTAKPMTSYTVDQIMTDLKPTYYTLMVYATAYYAVNILVADWVHNGMEIELDSGITISNRLSDYEGLADRYKETFTNMLETVKSQLYFSKTKIVKTPKSKPSGRYATYSKFVKY